jgi:glycine cleavage system H protein
MSNIPEDLRYTEEHEWVRVQGNIATIGITAYAAEQLGGVTFIEFPGSGQKVSQMDVIGSIESYKGFSDLFSPVSGEVVEVNDSLMNAWELVDSDPYGRGWLVKVKIDNPGEIENLLTATAYSQHIKK